MHKLLVMLFITIKNSFHFSQSLHRNYQLSNYQLQVFNTQNYDINIHNKKQTRMFFVFDFFFVEK